MVLIRNLLFMVALAIFTPLYALIGMATFPFGPKTRHKLIRGWPRIMAWVIKHVLGIPYRLIGSENIPAGPAIVISKHMSAWETIMLQDVFPPMVFVMKRELHKVPFFGWGISQMPMIAIDRAAGKDALNQVVEQGSDRLNQGFWVTVFPEGTRVAPGTTKRYKPGGAYLATHVGCKVVPVAHDAGEYWPRQAFLKKAGTVTVSIGPAFDATGMSEAEVNKKAEAWIEAEMRRISPHRYPDASSRP